MQRRRAEENLVVVAASFKTGEAKFEGGRFEEYRDQGEEEDSGDEWVGVVGITQLAEDHDE